MSTPPIVIIAEPDLTLSNILRVEFSHWDFAVLLATSGQEAEDYAAQTVAHLVILDTKLNLGAYAACARIRRLPGYAVRPIVLTTNELSAKVTAAAQKAGATVLVPKPYSVDGLFTAIKPFVPVDDLLFTHRARGGGISAPKEWPLTPPPTWQAGDNSALTRNSQLLPIVRRQGVKIPLFRKL